MDSGHSLLLGLLFLCASAFFWLAFRLVPHMRSIWSKIRSWKTLRKAETQWTDSLLLISGALQGGMNLEQALELFCKEAPWPLKGVLDKRTEGFLPFSLEEKIEHLFCEKDQFFIRSALSLAHVSGGKAAFLVQQGCRLMKEQKELKRKMEMRSLQAKWTAWIVGCSPFVFLALMSFLAPELSAVFWKRKAGWFLATLLVLLTAVGIVVVHRMARVEA